MSWDVLILNTQECVRNIADLESDRRLQPLCLDLAALHERILEVFPQTNWSDPEWGHVTTDHGSIEFNVGSETPPTDMMLHVRAAPPIVSDILRLSTLNGWEAFDCSNGERLDDHASAAPSIEASNRYVAQVLGKD